MFLSIRRNRPGSHLIVPAQCRRASGHHCRRAGRRGGIIFVLVWFQPQKLFLNKTVSEPAPGVIATAPARETHRDATADGSPPPALRVVRSGSFSSLEHAT